MNMTGNPMKYGYSNTRVKAMEAKLLSGESMQTIINAKDVGTILTSLVQTDYNKAMLKFGGVEMKQSLIDFALSQNFAERMTILVKITPKSDHEIVRTMVRRFGLSNVKLALEAKDRGLTYDDISKYVLDYGSYDMHAVKEAFKENSITEMLNRFLKERHSSPIIKAAIAAYAKKKDVFDAIAAIDEAYYKSYSELIAEVSKRSEPAAELLKMEIDAKNIITLIRAKGRRLQFKDISDYIIENGDVSESNLKKSYESASNVEALAQGIKAPGMKEALESYKSSKQLISFEIGLRNAILIKSMKTLRHSVLSFGTIISYIYSKEIEVLTLRILVKSKAYGLSKDEVSRLITWKLN